MKSNGASPFRTSMVEIGHGIAALKADLFDKLMVRLARDLRGASRTRNGARSGRRTGIHDGDRASSSARTKYGTIS